jgi:PhnB protein
VDEKRYGDRSGSLEDPFGYTWHVATHRKDVTPEEILAASAAD